MECACAPDCPARCVPERKCDELSCPCYLLWEIEGDELARQTAHLSAEELHRLAAGAWEVN